jgi:hypothetical protein
LKPSTDFPESLVTLFRTMPGHILSSRLLYRRHALPAKRKIAAARGFAAPAEAGLARLTPAFVTSPL